MMRLCRRAAAIVLVLAGCVRPAMAHPVPFSYLDLHLHGDAIEGTLVAHIFDVAHDLNIDAQEKLLEPGAAAGYRDAFVRMIGPRLVVTADGQMLTPSWSGLEALVDRQSVRINVRYPVKRAPGAISVSAALFPYDPMHQTFVNLYEGEALTQAILSATNPRFEYFSGSSSGALAVAARFIPSGIRHILASPDHIIFLIGLLLLGGTLRHLVIVASAFTLANAVALTLAALGYLTPPARIIEPALALTIVYVGADNLLVRGGRDMRIWIAFAFGAIHGLGYANFLRGAGLQARAVIWSILPFTLGVEIAQIALVLLIVAALAVLRRRNDEASQRMVLVGSVLVAATGTVWFVQRVFFPGKI